LSIAVRLSPRVFAGTLLVLFFAACPKPEPPQSTPEPPPDQPNVVIDSVSPNETREGRAVTVTVMGRGFEEGAKVYLNSRSMSGVDVYDGGELTFRATEDLSAGKYDVQVELPNGDDAVKRNGFTVRAKPRADGDCTLDKVAFDFNEAGLTSAARDVIAAAARCIEARGLAKVRLEGHADERGSTEYNLSLGQRRAESVRNYLVGLGLAESRLDTLSYGEERPAARGHDQASWDINRRVEFAIP
jgi:peptidoglycan-associated lipoprotein